jgi:hypothetical protein
MGSLTSRLRLFKPASSDTVDVIADLNNNFDTIDSNVGTFICSSTTRPSGGALFVGLQIFETDTLFEYVWDGAQWQLLSFASGAVQNVGRTDEGASSAAVTTVETVVTSITFNAINGKYYNIEAHCQMMQSVAGDYFLLGIREDNIAGASIFSSAFSTGTAAFGVEKDFNIAWAASATSVKTMVFTLLRGSGSGSCIRQAKSSFRVNRYW